jgi:S-adenosylmethionine:tRNA ribosyltransferase-isomerase
MQLSDLDYLLPPGQIAQRPLPARDASRMLLLDRSTGSFEDRSFAQFPELLFGDELLVVNNARVIPARLLGTRILARGLVEGAARQGDGSDAEGGEVEVLLSRQLDVATWEALVRPGRKMRVGQRVQFGEGRLEAEVIAHGDHGHRTLRFTTRDREDAFAAITALGHMPLPPYIDRADEDSDRERYQTIFASHPGAIAAPTAGLHFTPTILEKIAARAIEICQLTLHVGLGTFQPIRSDSLEGHEMHAERYEISPETAALITKAKRDGRRILAIGTTAVRALEDAALRAVNAPSQDGSDLLIPSGDAEARLFITPGFQFRIVDALLTNFHLPRSTLLALVCAFAGKSNTLAAYNHAVEAGYRFYSYGDCMLIR